MDLSFDQSKARLEEIAQTVTSEEVSLEDALSLFEEAVSLGMHACDVSEQDLQLNAVSSEEEIPEDSNPTEGQTNTAEESDQAVSVEEHVDTNSQAPEATELETAHPEDDIA